MSEAEQKVRQALIRALHAEGACPPIEACEREIADLMESLFRPDVRWALIERVHELSEVDRSRK